MYNPFATGRYIPKRFAALKDKKKLDEALGAAGIGKIPDAATTNAATAKIRTTAEDAKFAELTPIANKASALGADGQPILSGQQYDAFASQAIEAGTNAVAAATQPVITEAYAGIAPGAVPERTLERPAVEPFTAPRAAVPSVPALNLNAGMIKLQVTAAQRSESAKSKKLRTFMSPEQAEKVADKLNINEPISANEYEQLKPILETSMAGRATIAKHESEAGEVEERVDAWIAAGGAGDIGILDEGTNVVSGYATKYLQEKAEARDEKGRLISPDVAPIVKAAQQQQALQTQADAINTKAGRIAATVKGTNIVADAQYQAEAKEGERIAAVTATRNAVYAEDEPGINAWAADNDISVEAMKQSVLENGEAYRLYLSSPERKTIGGARPDAKGTSVVYDDAATTEEAKSYRAEIRRTKNARRLAGLAAAEARGNLGKSADEPVDITDQLEELGEGYPFLEDGEPSTVSSAEGLDAIPQQAIDEFLKPDNKKSMATIISDRLKSVGEFDRPTYESELKQMNTAALQILTPQREAAAKAELEQDRFALEPMYASVTQNAESFVKEVEAGGDAFSDLEKMTDEQIALAAEDAIKPEGVAAEHAAVFELESAMVIKNPSDDRVSLEHRTASKNAVTAMKEEQGKQQVATETARVAAETEAAERQVVRDEKDAEIQKGRDKITEDNKADGKTTVFGPGDKGEAHSFSNALYESMNKQVKIGTILTGDGKPQEYAYDGRYDDIPQWRALYNKLEKDNDPRFEILEEHLSSTEGVWTRSADTGTDPMPPMYMFENPTSVSEVQDADAKRERQSAYARDAGNKGVAAAHDTISPEGWQQEFGDASTPQAVEFRGEFEKLVDDFKPSRGAIQRESGSEDLQNYVIIKGLNMKGAGVNKQYRELFTKALKSEMSKDGMLRKMLSSPDGKQVRRGMNIALARYTQRSYQQVNASAVRYSGEAISDIKRDGFDLNDQTDRANATLRYRESVKSFRKDTKDEMEAINLVGAGTKSGDDYMVAELSSAESMLADSVFTQSNAETVEEIRALPHAGTKRATGRVIRTHPAREMLDNGWEGYIGIAIEQATEGLVSWNWWDNFQSQEQTQSGFGKEAATHPEAIKRRLKTELLKSYADPSELSDERFEEIWEDAYDLAQDSAMLQAIDMYEDFKIANAASATHPRAKRLAYGG